MTLARVAEHAGVALSTASLAFNTPNRVAAATRDRILGAARELGYAGPDPRGRNLRCRRSRTVAIAVGRPFSRTMLDPSVATLVADVLSACSDRSYSVSFVMEETAADAALRTADALVCIGIDAHCESRTSLPVVRLLRPTDWTPELLDSVVH